MDEYTRRLYEKSAMQSSSSAFAELAGSVLDYGSLNVEASSARIQAENIELAAKQRANMLREKYNNAVGNVYFSTASRGGKITSGSVRSNIEQSAKNLGEDIASEGRNAKMAADSARLKASLMERQAKAQLASGITKSINYGMDAYSTYNIANAAKKG